MATILVLDGHTYSALSVVRSLGSLGHRVLVASDRRSFIAGWSRYSAVRLRSPKIGDDAESYVCWVAEAVARHRVDQLFWTTNDSTLALALWRDLLPPSLLRDLPEAEVVDAVFDKARTIEVACALGIPVPRTWLLRDEVELRESTANISMPCVIKPRSSCQVVGRRIRYSGTPRYALDAESALGAFRQVHGISPKPMIQEFVPGYGFGVFLIMQDGEPVAGFAHRRLREADPTGSGSAFRESIDLPREAYEYSIELLRAMRWRGVAMVEFKQDQRDGRPKLMEINGRFWNSLALCLAAGVDYPRLLLKMKEGSDLDRRPIPYQSGVKRHWLGGEFMHLFKVIKGRPVGFPGAFPRRLPTFVGMLRDLVACPHFDSLQADDIRPALFECWLILRRQI